MFVAIIPRIIWPDKPFKLGGSAFYSKYSGMAWNDDTSIGIPYFFELYANGGTQWVVVGLFLVGYAVARCELELFKARRTMAWILSMMALTGVLSFGGSRFEQIVISSIASSVGAYALAKPLEWLNDSLPPEMKYWFGPRLGKKAEQTPTAPARPRWVSPRPPSSGRIADTRL